ncbi:glycoside hydrolase family 3 protein [Acidipropionibacterium virtanenii]|uniref:beta-N-acetylhexosaminidase n=1 Tax=Acidipropionibacterium virtanenii TaxID=2057246 RepID=A0A344UV56_9ACTN|nr:glycoside hydrolase family 3 protein [Acidipropionibacterium virtanenii]AXE39154.1 Beta-hexosaminidase [Acidipropionibacterium virtanenii]
MSIAETPEEILARMSLAEKIGQLMMCEVYGTDPDRPHEGNGRRFGVPTAAEAVRALHLGSAIYFRWTDSFAEGPGALAGLSRRLQEIARQDSGTGMLIATDQEQGPSSRFGPPATLFPGAMALAAAGDPGLARRSAAITGAELMAVGINVDLAPDADVNVNPANPVIGVRSFGSDPGLVARMVAAQVSGYQDDAGVSACAKHFPGHGDTSTDSHTGLPVIEHDRSLWERVDAPPFRSAIEAGVDMVMTAHIRLPELEPDGQPATLSRRVLDGMLRTGLGFDGVIITDSLQMSGVRQDHDDPEIAVRALLAGADLILMPPDPLGARDAVTAAVTGGRLPPAELDAKVLRVLRLKARRGLLRGGSPIAAPDLSVVGSPAHREVADQVAAAAVTRVNEGAPLPGSLAGLRVLVCGWGEAQDGDLVALLAGRLRGFGAVVRGEQTGREPSAAAAAGLAVAARDQDLVVCLTHDVAAGSAQAELVGRLAESGTTTVAVSVGVPYDAAYLPAAVTQLAVYSLAPPAVDAVARVLAGQSRAEGALPVEMA